MSDDCKHWEGDTVDGYWICAKCFTRLPDQPRRYYKPIKITDMESDQPVPPQEVTLAPVAVHEGVTLGQFISSMAARLVSRTRGSFTMAEATSYAIDLLQGFGDSFGAKDMAWDAGGAWELVDEDMQHWDADEGATN